MLLDAQGNVIAGPRYDLSAEQVIRICRRRKPGITKAKMIELIKRAFKGRERLDEVTTSRLNTNG